MNRYLTRKEVADRLRVTPWTISYWMKRGKIKGYRIDKKLLFPENEIEAVLQKAAQLKGR